jgi:hypothetical protein
MEKSLENFLLENGYENLREIPEKGVCGLMRFAFTTGLVIGLDEAGYYGRYCYSSRKDAETALSNWDGNGDPEGEWIKYKGEGGERRNTNYED